MIDRSARGVSVDASRWKFNGTDLECGLRLAGRPSKAVFRDTSLARGVYIFRLRYLVKITQLRDFRCTINRGEDATRRCSVLSTCCICNDETSLVNGIHTETHIDTSIVYCSKKIATKYFRRIAILLKCPCSY